ncbi:pilus assembly protein PilM [Thalassobacillus hwangdonensis]|uniref:Pilus assembly protein PilM n=1 Tax=Thalassobacillus hwangdonensis TaxID=546108 RepID=A0ABW3L0M3_9BACI
MEEKIFALDIGTRSVVGIILVKSEKRFEVIDLLSMEHEERSMLDGQIHDVMAVSKVIRAIKEQLESKHGPLKEVCVAAAGRALKTKRVTIGKDIERQPLMDQEAILHMELSAVQQAQYELATEHQDSSITDYYCVGYSLLHYHLDGQLIGSLIDQQGKKVEVEIIATFLPKIVVESLLSALHRAGLEMRALTLEPIAAIQVLIPPSMRRLNVALVDIGAGTSDIAITDSGTVTAYGMVPSAGDEITEAISDHYLLDFPKAEEAKRSLSNKEPVVVTDILGFDTEVTYENAVSDISDAIQQLTDRIADEIIELNSKAPKAVMLVGGGSQTPDLARRLADRLNLPENRVAIRGTDAIQQLSPDAGLPKGPEMVTPLGIAIAAESNPVHYISVQVNGITVRMFDMKQLTVGDCLLAAGIDMKRLTGRPGMAYIVTMNGKSLTLPGQFGTSPILQLNGKSVSYEDHIQNGDCLTVEEGKQGASPDYTVEDLIGNVEDFPIKVNDQHYKWTNPLIRVNGEIVSKDMKLKDHDNVTYQPIRKVADILGILNLSFESNHRIFVKVNGEQLTFDCNNALAYDGTSISMDAPIQPGGLLTLDTHGKNLTTRDVLDRLALSFEKEVDVFFDDEPVKMTKQYIQVRRNDELLSIQARIYDGDVLKVDEKKEDPFIFQDIFRYVDIDLTNSSGHFKIYRNDQPSTFFEEINPGDRLGIKWFSVLTDK